MITYLAKIGELTLKGSNIKSFENKLVSNAKSYLENCSCTVKLRAGRMYVETEDKDTKEVEFMLNHLIGITGWAKTEVCEKNIESITQTVTALGKKAALDGAKTFKIEARRQDKGFPLDSYAICREAAQTLYEENVMKVDVHKPEVIINVEVREKCFVYANTEKGCRGLPVGVSGKGLLLLSGGLDSPVAGYRMIRRGMKVECVYFHSYPYTSEEAQKKVETLAEKLSYYGIDTYLNIIPFTDVQMRIKQKSPENWSTLLLRMCMMSVANKLAERTHSQCIITGESLGQVASQTIENMNVTESMADFPLFRPLVGLDKEEIVQTANFIDTYETSILPYEDCCVLFSPKHPVLKASIDEAKEIYAKLEIEELIQKSFDERVIKHFSVRASEKKLSI